MGSALDRLNKLGIKDYAPGEIGISNVQDRNTKAAEASSNAPATKQVATPVNIKALGAGDYGASKQTRLNSVVNAGVKSTQSSLANIRGQLLAPTGELTIGQNAQAAVHGISQQTAEAEKTASQRKYQAKAYALADNLAKQSAEDTAKAKQGLGGFGRTLVDVGVAGTQMIGDLAANAILPGSGLAAMGIRSYGQSSHQARQAGANELQQVGYGAASAAVEMLTEKMFDGIAGLYGGGVADDVVEKVIGKIAKTPKSMTALRALTNFSGEGLEEIVSDAVNPIIRSIYDGKSVGENYSQEKIADWLHDGLVGGILGVVGAGTQIINGTNAKKNAEARAANGYASFKPMTESEQAAHDKVLALNPQPAKQTASPDIVKILAGTYENNSDAQSGATEQATAQDNAKSVITPAPAENAPTAKQDAPTEIVQPTDKSLYNKRDGKGGWGEKYDTAMEAVNDAVKVVNPRLFDALTSEAHDGATHTPIIDAVIAAQEDVRQDTITPMQAAEYISRVYSNDGVDGLSALYNPKNGNLYDEVLADVKALPASAATPQNAAETGFISENVIPPAATENAPQGAQQAAGATQTATAVMDRGNDIHIDDRSLSDVSSRKVKAFQYDHPELHPYFIEAANGLDYMLSNTQKGERYAIRDEDGYFIGSTGTKRSTTPQVAGLLDNANLSYAQIKKAIDDLRSDNGQENYAAAKKVELALDDMLTHGFEIDGEWIPPNEAYINAKNTLKGNGGLDGYSMTEDEWNSIMSQEPQSDGLGAADKGFATTPYTEWMNNTDEGGFHPISDTAAQNVVEQQSRAPMEIPKQDVNGGLTSKQVSTIVNSGITPDDFASALANDAATGKFSHMAYSDAEAVHKAEQTILGKSWDVAYTEYKDAVKDGKVSKDITASGIVLYNNAVTSGDYAKAMDIASTMIGNSTNVGQAMQAMNLLNKLSPEGKLYMAQKAVDDINERVKARLGDKFDGITVDPDLMKAYKEALDSGDKTAAQKAWVDIEKNVAAQIPSSWVEKANAWRYLAMLGNPRTHIRNIVGNAGFMPVRMMKNALAAGIERVTLGKAGEGSGRTKAALNLASAEDRQLLQAGWSEYADVEGLIQSGGKFNDTPSEIDSMRTIFKAKGIETVRTFNNTALDVEDTWFSRPAYAESLAGYLKANGISAKDYMEGNISAEVKTAAQEYAVKEAQKATYRDTNLFSETISKAGKSKSKVLNTLVEGVLPFKKTPANILARAVEYSPIELVKAISYDAFQVKTGNMQASEMIDHLASGLTGTGLMALGGLLASLGVLSGGSSGDDKKDNFDKLQGQQQYALTVGDKNYTLDWLTPEALPLFCGVELFNSFIDNGAQAKDFYTSMTRLASPIVEMSMLQGVNDMIDNVSYADSSGKLWAMASSAATSYLSQYIPTLGGQIERSIESTRQSTYTDPNSALPKDWQYAIAKAANKIPGVEYDQIPYVDAWGRTQDTGNVAERLFGNFLSPAYSSKNNTTALDTELQRLYDAGQTNVLPQRAATSVKVNDEYLTGDEYEQYQTTKGQTSYDILRKAVSTFDYKNMTDEQKAKAVAGAYEYSTYKANRQIAAQRGETSKDSEWDKYADAEKIGVDFWTMWKIKHPEDKNGNGRADQKEQKAALNAIAGLTPTQKAYIRNSIK